MCFGVGSTYWELTDATPPKKNIDLKKGSIYIVFCSIFDLYSAITLLCVLLRVYLGKMLTKRSKYYLFVAVNFLHIL